MKMLRKRIDDPKFLKVIERMLKAGYLEDWKFNKTHSGTPQGGIFSPILANVYLHELDEYLSNLIEKWMIGKRRKVNPEYKKFDSQKYKLRKQINLRKENNESYDDLLKEVKILTAQQLQTPYSAFEDEYRRLYSVRYADDWVMGFIGSKKDAEVIMNDVKKFVEDELNLEISKEKSGIKHHSKGVRFLGYDLLIHKSSPKHRKVLVQGKRVMRRSPSCITRIAPDEKLMKFALNKGWGTLDKPLHRAQLLNNSDLEILLQYNAEMRGIAHYYSLASDFHKALGKLYRICQISYLKTMASKHKTSVNKMAKRLKKDNGYVLKTNGKEYNMVKLKEINREPKGGWVDNKPSLMRYIFRTELIDRLNARICEYCGKDQGYFQVHHIHKMKDIKEGKELWQKHMIARNRKTLVLCLECQSLLHSGNLPDWRYMSGMGSRVLAN